MISSKSSSIPIAIRCSDILIIYCSFQPPSFFDRKGRGTCDALLCMSYTLQSALESGQEARIVQIDFSAAFDSVNHPGILY